MRSAPLVFTTILITTPGLTFAQSVLERVLGQIDGASNLAQVNGTFANIAENVAIRIPGTPATPGTPAEDASPMIVNFADAEPTDILFRYSSRAGDVITVADIGNPVDLGGRGYTQVTINADGTVTWVNLDPHLSLDSWAFTDPSGTFRYFTIVEATAPTSFDNGFNFNSSDLNVYVDGTTRYLAPTSVAETLGSTVGDFVLSLEGGTPATPGTPAGPDLFVSPDIDGSITNIVTGVTAATAEAVAGSVTATELAMPAIDFGDMATTVLGGVNTGEIMLGMNAALDEAATSTTNAISAAVSQIGGSADTGALVLNLASNAGAIDGSIDNTLEQVNGSVGTLSTTTLGAVSTGTIVSGVDSAVQGIVGRSGQSSRGL